MSIKQGIIQDRKDQKRIGQINDYEIIRQLGKGSFGTIYEGIKKQKGQTLNQTKNLQVKEPQITRTKAKIMNSSVAIKCEDISNPQPMLQKQFQILSQLMRQSELNVNYSFPIVYEYGLCQTFSYIVLQKLQQTLDNKIKKIKDVINPITCLNIMYQMLLAIQGLHQIQYIHRDIKPGNLMIRKIKDSDRIVLIDYGLCKKYTKGNEHINYKEGKKMIGTPIFCSRNAHLGIQLSRRDDLESWLYTGLSLFNRLPWEQYSLQKDKELQKQLIKNSKLDLKIGQIKDIPQCFSSIYGYINNLQFSQTPNYCLVYNLLSQSVKLKGGSITQQIDWNPVIVIDEVKPKNIKIKFQVKSKSSSKPKINIQNLPDKNMFENIISGKINEGKQEKSTE